MTVDYAAIARDDRFRALRVRHRALTLMTAVLALGWYLAYALLSAFAGELMERPVLGEFNAGLTLGLLQFAVPWLLAALHALYTRFALDPLADELRAEAGRATTARLPVVPPTPPGPPAAERAPAVPAPRRRSPSPVSGLRRDAVSGEWTDLGRPVPRRTSR
ncbi:DUF485 domain-containing protein [Thermomonospora catenispora]|uniref:DUF485 domain-containing protein n=1 Tax=Thermomonospora catenispora TaxID=2493090 RepID=UPI0011214CC5|nr:DUF485 domain-containing protein [Thermomonospora catenispora]TNY35888.1 DUF485 domain-containing protein [Thermomonospora catenispora]